MYIFIEKRDTLNSRIAVLPSQKLTIQRKGIQSVEIGVGVLNAVVRLGKAAALTEIARESGMSTSQTHRYLASFVNSGLLRQDIQSGLYDMASGAIRIGMAAMARLDIFAEAGKVVQEFVDSTGRTALITVWSEQGPTVIRWFAGNPPVFTTISIGWIKFKVEMYWLSNLLNHERT